MYTTRNKYAKGIFPYYFLSFCEFHVNNTVFISHPDRRSPPYPHRKVLRYLLHTCGSTVWYASTTLSSADPRPFWPCPRHSHPPYIQRRQSRRPYEYRYDNSADGTHGSCRERPATSVCAPRRNADICTPRSSPASAFRSVQNISYESPPETSAVFRCAADSFPFLFIIQQTAAPFSPIYYSRSVLQ